MAINIGRSSIGKPPPQFYRRFERAFLVVFIPTAVLMINQWNFKDQILALRLQLIISVGVTALIKGIGMIISDDTETYSDSKTDDNNDQKPQ